MSPLKTDLVGSIFDVLVLIHGFLEGLKVRFDAWNFYLKMVR